MGKAWELASGAGNASGNALTVLPSTAGTQRSRLEKNREDLTVSELDFAELSDGSLVEMIEDPEDATRTLFAHYRGQSINYTDRIEDLGRIFVPPPRETEILKYVRLAQGAEPYGKIQNLDNEVRLLLRACLDLEDTSLTLMTAFVISTWLQENSPIAPYLALVGPPGSGKTTAMRVLNLLCYRSLFTTDISPSAFYDICHRLRSILLIDETLTAGEPRKLIHLLKASSTPDAVSLRKGSARLAYGAKVFAWLELPNDAALNNRCLILPMHKTSNTDLKRPNNRQVLECAATARKHLLHFRFERFKHTALPEAPGELDLSARLRDLYQAIAFPFIQDQRVCRKLAHLVAQQWEHHNQILSPAQISLLRVIYMCMHQNAGWLIPIKHLTSTVNHDLAKRGELHKLNERKIGHLLTSLSLTSRMRTNKGYVLSLGHSDRVRIHASVRDYRIEGMSGYPMKRCALCRKAAKSSTSAAGPSSNSRPHEPGM